MTQIDKTYHPESIEKKWYQTWEESGYFKPTDQGDAYCIMLPPPNVTGSLHMGHGFGFTLIDVLIRYQRMCGKNTLWQAGTDHAGIATQMVVEKQLNLEGVSRQDLGREKFVEKIWQWQKESGGNITRQLRRLGASIDWEKERFTLDPELSQTVRTVFIQLYQEGLIYRGERLVNWDPQLLTAISDLEVNNEETEGQLWHISYPLADTANKYIIVATTRPETLFGDVAIAVHPDDERYQHLIGKQVKLPLTNKTIPIIADYYVDPLFGSGFVKITPAHDFNDYAVGLRHHFKPINIFTDNAHLNANVPEKYQGLERFKARELVIKDLEKENLIVKVDKHLLKIPRGERSGAVIEPYLTKQWFMKMKPLAEPAIKAVENGHVKFIPENWHKTFYQWMHNIEDWCISRQLWWGHRIPVWYDDKGNAYAGHDEDDVRKQNNLGPSIALRQDEDVLDTWFSAALWPFSSLGWPEQTQEYKTFFPTNVLITGFDIIFFWVARMIMLGIKFTKQVPFREVYITGLIRDAEGHKMSKSKGNVLDPIDLIDGIELEPLIKKRIYGLMQPKMADKIAQTTRKEYPEGIPSFGTDALRFTFCSVASYTREIRFDINRLAGYRNFCNKLWNASRYILMNTEGKSIGVGNADREFSLADIWINSILQKTIEQAHLALSQYRFDHFAQILYDFTWNEFCDWYVELSKPVLNSTTSTMKMLQATRYTLINVFETLLRLLHPIMPFITEEIWQKMGPLVGKNNNSIMQTFYPKSNETEIDEQAVKKLEWIKSVIIQLRTIRSENNISPSKQLPVFYRGNIYHEDLISHLAKIASFTVLKRNETPPPSVSAYIDDLEIFIPMAGFINKEEESARLQKEMSKLQKDLILIEKKLNNPQFTEKAPAEVVEKERAKFTEINETLKKLRKQLEELNKSEIKKSSN